MSKRTAKATGKTCPVPGCDWIIADGSIMCAHHWQLLPMHLQRAARNRGQRSLTPLQREQLQTQIREQVIESPL